jgi:hypothetical protein
MPFNTQYGVNALMSITTGEGDSAFGHSSMSLATTAMRCTSVGYFSMNGNISGADSSSFGAYSLFSASNPVEIVAFGAYSLYSLDGGVRDVAVGFEALYSATTASDCISIGHHSQYSNSVNSRNISLGTRSLFNCIEDDNVSIGFESMLFANLATGSVSIGNRSLRLNANGSNNVSVGDGSLEECEEGSACVSVGARGLTSNNVNGSTGVGYQVGFSNVTGLRFTGLGYQAALSANADDTTALGYEALKLVTGAGNTGAGASAGASFANLTNCTFLGANSDAGADNLENSTAIGANAVVSVDNALVLGDENVKVGIGTPSPAEKLEIRGGAVYHRALTSGFTGSYRKDLQYAVQTTDATATTIASHALAAGQMITLKGTVSGFQSDKTDAFAADFFVSAFRPDPGDAQMLDPYLTVVHSATATGTDFILEMDVDTSTIHLKVTGLAAQTWNWFTDHSLTSLVDSA